MESVLRLIGGSEVHCADGHCGSLARLVIEPDTKTVSHLSVEVPGLSGASRLVPVALVKEAGESVLLGCTKADFDAFEHGEETHVAPDLVIRGGGLPFSYLTLDRIPVGDVEVSGEERIEATDGHIGRLRGLEVESIGFEISLVLLEIGHLSGKRTVEVAASAVTQISGDEMKLSMTKAQVAELP